MDHIITSIDQIEVGDKLLLLSNVGVTDTNPNGHDQYLHFVACVPKFDIGNHRPDPESLMREPELHVQLKFGLRTSMTSMQVIAKTQNYIMVDLIVRGRVERHNVIMTKSDFRCEFLNHPNWSCCKKYTNNPRSLAHDAGGGQNPRRSPSPEPDFSNSPSIPQANRYMIHI